jgi:PAS domain S-box-containing protein|tara:strand:+ start:52835 stop:54838 length:2004 start_codon:yes stop_codon:yes gene_type:complete
MMEGQNDLFKIENIEEAEIRQRLLYQIVSQTDTNLDIQLDNALKLSTQLLGMEIGIISKVVDQTYIIQHHYAKHNGLENGQKFKLGHTFCAITLESNRAIAIDYMKESPWSRHPCYEFFELESYIGIPIIVDDDIYGTLNFSSSKPKKDGFIAADRNLIKLLSQWISGIIKRKQVEKQLQDQKELYRLISKNSADMICLHDPDGTYKFVSPSVENLLGYTPKELVGKNPYEFFHPKDQERIKSESHQKALEKDPSRNFHYRIRKKDGSYVWFDTATEIITDEEGEVVSLQTTSRDISKQKNLEILFAQAQKMANVGGWEINLESGKLFWTDEVYRIHEKEIGSEVFLDEGLSYFPKEAQETLQESLKVTLETGEPYDLVLPFTSAKGTKKWVRAIGKALFAEGKAYKLHGTFQDITKQKEYQQKINLQNKELQNLTETQDKLYSIIGHDLKGAFFGITGMLELLMYEAEDYSELDDDFTHKLEMVQQSSRQAHQLFENLLGWTRLKRDTLEPNYSKFELTSEINKVLSLFKSTAESKQITINTDYRTSAEINADSSMVSTIFRNLISNALKFSEPESEIDITISETETDTVISIKDYGIGMPEKVRARLFDPSSRPKRKGTNQEKGTGLGMLLCKEMIDLHQGTIKVNTKEGEGTEFIVKLPKKMIE